MLQRRRISNIDAENNCVGNIDAENHCVGNIDAYNDGFGNIDADGRRSVGLASKRAQIIQLLFWQY